MDAKHFWGDMLEPACYHGLQTRMSLIMISRTWYSTRDMIRLMCVWRTSCTDAGRDCVWSSCYHDKAHVYVFGV